MTLAVLIVSILITAGVSDPVEITKQLPRNRERVLEVILDQTRYSFGARRLTWSEAKVECEKNYGSLVVLNEEKKARFAILTIRRFEKVSEDWWIGASFDTGQDDWRWIGATKKVELNEMFSKTRGGGKYSAWVERPDSSNSSSAQCGALGRRGHDMPIFFNLPCNNTRPYICQIPSENITTIVIPPTPTTSMYSLYFVSLSWEQAKEFCETIGTRLAVITDQKIFDSFSTVMKLHRPEVESAWVGGRKVDLKWKWINGEEVPSNLCVEWHENGKLYNDVDEEICLSLDRHNCITSKLVEEDCDNMHAIICETVEEKNENGTGTWHEIGFGDLYLYMIPLTWHQAAKMCELENNGHLLQLNKELKGVKTDDDKKLFMENIANALILAPLEVLHIWLGGYRIVNNKTKTPLKKWAWVNSANFSSTTVSGWDLVDLKSWTILNADDNDESFPCLNLDRVHHSTLVVYGMQCNFTQYFICQINKTGKRENPLDHAGRRLEITQEAQGSTEPNRMDTTSDIRIPSEQTVPTQSFSDSEKYNSMEMTELSLPTQQFNLSKLTNASNWDRIWLNITSDVSNMLDKINEVNFQIIPNSLSEVLTKIGLILNDVLVEMNKTLPSNTSTEVSGITLPMKTQMTTIADQISSETAWVRPSFSTVGIVDDKEINNTTPAIAKPMSTKWTIPKLGKVDVTKDRVSLLNTVSLTTKWIRPRLQIVLVTTMDKTASAHTSTEHHLQSLRNAALLLFGATEMLNSTISDYKGKFEKERLIEISILMTNTYAVIKDGQTDKEWN